jgi:hypothetical protein
LEIGPPDQPMVLQRAMDLMSERLGIDATRLAGMERWPMDVFTSIVAEACRTRRSNRRFLWVEREGMSDRVEVGAPPRVGGPIAERIGQWRRLP